MDASIIIGRLTELGVTVHAEGGNVLIQPASKTPQDLKDAIRENKAAVLALLSNPPTIASLLDRLRKGQIWLTAHHAQWIVNGPNAASDTEFSRVWNAWWELDQRLRAEHGFEGCICAPSGKCLGAFQCLGCMEVLTPAAVAQLALIGD